MTLMKQTPLLTLFMVMDISKNIIGFLLAGTVLAFDNPTFLGPVFPTPLNLGANSAWPSAIQSITGNLTAAITAARGESNENSLAVRGISVSDATPLFEFYHTARSISATGAQEVNADTVFRIGSISKLFTVYSLLLSGGFDVFEDPVTEYVPELREFAKNPNINPIEDVDWKDVTVGALARQVSGILRDYNHADLATLGLPVEDFGLPPLPTGDIPQCDGNETQPTCSRQEFFQGLPKQPPVFPVFSTPGYSNANFRILSYVIQVITSSSFATAVERDVLDPLSLSNTYTIKPEDKLGIIPDGNSSWGQNVGQDLSTAGFYSSVKDLCNFGRAILKASQLSPAETRRWLKPFSHSASLLFSVGMPWEIFRQQMTDHVVDFYTKGGSLGAYNSILVLIPDYDVVFSVLAAGIDNSLVSNVAEVVRLNIMPILDIAAREQANAQYVGDYCLSSGGRVTDRITLSIDGGPGLLVDEWISNGQDFLAVVSNFALSTGSGALQTIRLYPTGLEVPGKIAFRATFNTSDPSPSDAAGLFSPGLESWGSVDNYVYGQKPMDLFLFNLDPRGVARAVECSAMRKVLPKC